MSGPDKLLVGLIGAGIQRSLTPAMQEDEARAQGLRLHYQLIDLDVSGAGCRSAAGTAGRGAHHRLCRAEHHLPVQAGGDSAARRAVSDEARGDGRGEHRRAPRRQAHRPQHRRLGLALGLPARAARRRPVARGAARRRRRRFGHRACGVAHGREAPGAGRQRRGPRRRAGRTPEHAVPGPPRQLHGRHGGSACKVPPD